MKTAHFSRQSFWLAVLPKLNTFAQYTHRCAYVALAFVVVLLATACHHPVDPVPEPGSGSTPPRDTTITKPGSSTSSQPGSGTSTQPGSSTGVPGQAGVFKTLKISWASTDFQEIQFDAADYPVQYTSQALYNQGTGQVQRHVYQFLYSPDQRLNQVTVAGGGYVQYTYAGNQIIRAEEFSSAGERLKTHVYQYSATNQLVQTDTQNQINKPQETRTTYQYDARGNLVILSVLVKNAQGTYDLETATSFANYDTQHHVEDLLTTYPFLPGITFRANNYHTKVVRYKDGSEISHESVAYAYNEEGYPIQQTRSGQGGTLTATYSY